MTVVDDLAGALLAAPHLPRARCVGSSALFDTYDDPAIVEAAINICQRCPELQPCKKFMESLPRRQQPFGVTAGVCRRPLKPRKQAA